MTKILITTSGIGERLQHLTKYTNKSLVKLKDKFAICYIIENYSKDCEFIITLGHFGDFVRQFLFIAYPGLKFTFVNIDIFKGDGSSLGYSMLKAKQFLQEPFIFHCCDSIILNPLPIFSGMNNVLFVSVAENSCQYTSVKVSDNQIIDIFEKNSLLYDYVYIGICHIYDYALFWELLEEKYIQNKYDTKLNDVDAIKKMIHNYQSTFTYKILDDWYDIGNLENYHQLQKIFKPDFNVLYKPYESICFLNDMVIKFNYDKKVNEKLIKRGEYLNRLVPKIIRFSENFICMEYIQGILLSELYDYRMIYDLLEWADEHLWIDEHIDTRYIISCRNFYVNKTLQRIHLLPFLKDEKNYINGLYCNDIRTLITNLPDDILTTDRFMRFHGDFILDNIIRTKDSYKLIDYRCEFDQDELYFGDVHYDLAKLRHNIIFNHKNIINDLFLIHHCSEKEITVDLKCNYFLIQQLKDFDEYVNRKGYNIQKIKLITAIIWLNMSPLHDEKLREFLFYFGKYNLSLIILQNVGPECFGRC